MSAPPQSKRPRGDLAASVDDSRGAASDGLRALLCSARGTAALLARHSAAAQSLVTEEEDTIDAMLACCALLLREHGVGLDVALHAIRILAALSEAEPASWRDLARLREHPLSSALEGCAEPLMQQLHTIAEVLQFPKPVSLLLQRQLAVFRIRRDAADDTATLVRAEAVLAPLLEQAEKFFGEHLNLNRGLPSGVKLRATPAFWRGFFGDAEDVESLITGRRELDHLAYGTGRLVGGRGLPPSLLQALPPSCASHVSDLAAAAAAVGDVPALAALHHTGRNVGLTHTVCVAAKAGQVEVIQLALALGWDFSVDKCLQVAAEANLSSGRRLQILSLFNGRDPALLRPALPAFAQCGDAQCVQRLLRLCAFDQKELDAAVVQAAVGGHIPIMTLLLENGASVPPAAFRASATVPVLQWCVERGCVVDAEFLKKAASAGRLIQLEWAASFMEVSGLLSAEVFAVAARGGKVSVMEWLRARGCPWDAGVLRSARNWRQWECLAFALRHGCPLDGFDLSSLGNLPLDSLKAAVQALQDSGRRQAANLAELYRGAKRSGRAKTAEWLVCDLGFPIAADDCAAWTGKAPLGYYAAAQGCLRLLQHLHSRGLHTLGPADMRAVVKGCFGGQEESRAVEVVRWLHAQGVPTYGSIRGYEDHGSEVYQPAADAADFLTFYAAATDAPELLQVFVEECGAHWAESTCVAAAEYGRMEVLRWAISKHCSCAADTWCAAVRYAGENDDYRPLALLHSAKRPWDETVWAAAVLSGDKEVQAWLRERGCPGSQAPPAAGAGAGAGAAGAAAAAGPRARVGAARA